MLEVRGASTDDARSLEIHELGFVDVEQTGDDLVGVLARRWCRFVEPSIDAGEPEGASWGRRAAHDRMVELLVYPRAAS